MLMPLSYSSGQAIDFNSIRNYHSGSSGAVSMRDFAIGGGMIHKPGSEAGSTEQGYNNLPTQAQLDAGTHSIDVNTHLRTTYGRKTNAHVSYSDDGSSSGISARSWTTNPSNTGTQSGYSQNWTTSGAAHLENYMLYAIAWNGGGDSGYGGGGLIDLDFQVNSAGYYYFKFQSGGNGSHTHNFQVTGSFPVGQSALNYNVVTPQNGYADTGWIRTDLNANQTYTISAQRTATTYAGLNAGIVRLMPNGDIDDSNKGSTYNHMYF